MELNDTRDTLQVQSKYEYGRDVGATDTRIAVVVSAQWLKHNWVENGRTEERILDTTVRRAPR